MSAKPLSSTVLLSLIVAWTAGAQPPAPGAPTETPAYGSAPAAATGSAGTVLANGFTPLPNSAGSRWLNSGESLPVGGDGPIGQELYLHTGPTIPLGNGVFGLHLNTGWMVEVGGRALLFRPANDAATTLRLGLTFQENQGERDAPTYKHFGMDVRTRSLIRYSGVFAVGREWFRHGRAPFGDGGNTLRYGIDFGSRWGGQQVALDVINDPVDGSTFRHRHDIFGGVVLGWHLKVEVPMESWVWFGGLRTEYGYNWSNMMTPQNSNIHDVNILLSTGFRY